MQKDKFNKWLAHAKAGDSITYYSGFMLLAGQYEATLDIRKAVQQAYMAGKVTLRQRRISDSVFEYVADRINGQENKFFELQKGI